jgi:hypothetical protein
MGRRNQPVFGTGKLRALFGGGWGGGVQVPLSYSAPSIESFIIKVLGFWKSLEPVGKAFC